MPLPPDETKYEIMIPYKEVDDVNAIIRKSIELSNKLGLEKKMVENVSIKKIFGEGIKITLETDNKWFKII